MISNQASRFQTGVGAAVLLLGLGMAYGALGISSEAGYGGVGPNFLPWVVAIALSVCGAWMVWESRTGGFRHLDADDGPAPLPAPSPSPPPSPYWPGFAWVSAGLLANAALITRIGFILSCTLCFVLAVQGLRGAEGKLGFGARTLLKDVLIGLAIAAPVFWMFTKFLAINLPGLTSTGWI